MAHLVAKAFVEERSKLGYPLLKNAKQEVGEKND